MINLHAGCENFQSPISPLFSQLNCSSWTADGNKRQKRAVNFTYAAEKKCQEKKLVQAGLEPGAVTHPSTNEAQGCLTLVIAVAVIKTMRHGGCLVFATKLYYLKVGPVP